MFDERVRALHGKRSSRRKYGDARKRVFAQPGSKQAEVIVCARVSDVCFFRPGGTNCKSLQRI